MTSIFGSEKPDGHIININTDAKSNIMYFMAFLYFYISHP